MLKAPQLKNDAEAYRNETRFEVMEIPFYSPVLTHYGFKSFLGLAHSSREDVQYWRRRCQIYRKLLYKYHLGGDAKTWFRWTPKVSYLPKITVELSPWRSMPRRGSDGGNVETNASQKRACIWIEFLRPKFSPLLPSLGHGILVREIPACFTNNVRTRELWELRTWKSISYAELMCLHCEDDMQYHLSLANLCTLKFGYNKILLSALELIGMHLIRVVTIQAKNHKESYFPLLSLSKVRIYCGQTLKGVIHWSRKLKCETHRKKRMYERQQKWNIWRK